MSQDECDHIEVMWKLKHELKPDCIIYRGKCQECEIAVKEVIMFHEPEYFYGKDAE